MYMLNINITNKQITIHKIHNDSSIFYGVAGITIPMMLNMGIHEYRKLALANVNLKIGTYVSPLEDHSIITYLYAETLEQATLWKDWVESLFLLQNMAR